MISRQVGMDAYDDGTWFLFNQTEFIPFMGSISQKQDYFRLKCEKCPDEINK